MRREKAPQPSEGQRLISRVNNHVRELPALSEDAAAVFVSALKKVIMPKRVEQTISAEEEAELSKLMSTNGIEIRNALENVASKIDLTAPFVELRKLIDSYSP